MNNEESTPLVLFHTTSAIILTIIGLTGNLTVFLIYTSKKFRKITMFRYYAVSVVFETLELLLIWAYNFPDFFQFNQNDFSCKIVQYFAYFFGVYVSWVGVAIAIDRLVNVKYPKKFLYRKKWSFQLTIFSIMMLLLMLIYLPFTFYNKIESQSNSSFCGVDDASTGFGLHISDFFVSTLIPFLIMLFSNCFIGYNLIRRKIKLNKKKLKRELKFFRVIISMDIYFLVCYFPWSAYVITNDVLTLYGSVPDFFNIVFEATNFLIFLYCSCSFFVHFSCNRQFRKCLIGLFIPKIKTNPRMKNSLTFWS